ncbi:MAG: hypothetical protein NZ730_11925 [Porticoccaceae bacterium]|nr:hypothetical protein [Porticoccaceae bacterium]
MRAKWNKLIEQWTDGDLLLYLTAVSAVNVLMTTLLGYALAKAFL